MEDKIFITTQGQIERFDYEFNNPSRLGFLNGIKNGNIVKLGDIIHDQGYGILPPSNSYNSESEIIYLRATELKPDLKIDFKSCFKVPKKYYSNNRAILKKNDILIAVKGATIASKKSVAYIEDDIGKAILNGSIFRFQTIEGINSKYIAYILDSDLGKKQMKFGLVANNAVDYLNKETLESIKIPLPPLEIQNQIVEKMDRALEIKKQKEKEAKDLLESIDDFVLGKLGIEYEEVEEKKIFGINLSELGDSKRMDSFYNNPKFLELEKRLNNGKYKLEKLDDLKEKIITGTTPSSKLQPYGNEGIIFFRNTNLEKNKINLDDVKYVREEFGNKLIYSEKNDVIICIAGTVGVSAVNNIGKISINQNVSALRLKENILSDYVSIFLNNKILIGFFDRVSSVATIKYINNSNLLTLPIPLPPLETQEKIADEVKSKIEKAGILEREAREIYESGKKEVEGIILGE